MTKRAALMVKFAVILAVVFAFGLLINPRYPVGTGGSMTPTIRDGQRCLYVRPWRGLCQGDIVIFDDPSSEGLAAKRVARIQGGWLWMKSDNPETSDDSRNYGWVHKSDVRGLMVLRLSRVFDGETIESPSRYAPKKKRSLAVEDVLAYEDLATMGDEIAHSSTISLPVISIPEEGPDVVSYSETIDVPSEATSAILTWEGRTGYVVIGGKRYLLEVSAGSSAGSMVLNGLAASTIKVGVPGNADRLHPIRFRVTFYRDPLAPTSVGAASFMI